MKKTLGKEISKQKMAIIVIIFLVVCIWAGVLLLEYKIGNTKEDLLFVQIEENLCLYLPKGCAGTLTGDYYSFYCKSGTAGKLYPGRKPRVDESSMGQIVRQINGKSKLYLLELNVNNNQNGDLGKAIKCP